MDDVHERLHRIDFHTADHGGLAGVHLGDNEPLELLASCLDRDGQSAANRTNPAVQRQLPNEYTVEQLFLVEATVRTQNPEGHRQVESRAFLADVGRSEIHGDVGGRDVVAAVSEGRAYAILTFA